MPWIPHPDTDRFLTVLAEMSFPSAYYALVDRHASGEARKSDGPESHGALLKELGEKAAYREGERCFEVARESPTLSSRLALMFRDGRLELGLSVKTPQGELGGTAHTLALQLAHRQQTVAKRTAHPAIPYGSADDERKVLGEVIALFSRLHDNLLTAAKTWA